MQGQRQQQVALQFGVDVSTIERLVRPLKDTGNDADRPRQGRPRVTTPRQDRAIHLAHLRNRHVTATEITLTTVGNHEDGQDALWWKHPHQIAKQLVVAFDLALAMQ
jgi:transposase